MRETHTDTQKKDSEYKHAIPLIFIESINVSGISQCVMLTVAADAHVSTMGTAEIHVKTESVLITRTCTEMHLGITPFWQTNNKNSAQLWNRLKVLIAGHKWW